MLNEEQAAQQQLLRYLANEIRDFFKTAEKNDAKRSLGKIIDKIELAKNLSPEEINAILSAKIFSPLRDKILLFKKTVEAFCPLFIDEINIKNGAEKKSAGLILILNETEKEKNLSWENFFYLYTNKVFVDDKNLWQKKYQEILETSAQSTTKRLNRVVSDKKTKKILVKLESKKTLTEEELISLVSDKKFLTPFKNIVARYNDFLTSLRQTLEKFNASALLAALNEGNAKTIEDIKQNKDILPSSLIALFSDDKGSPEIEKLMCKDLSLLYFSTVENKKRDTSRPYFSLDEKIKSELTMADIFLKLSNNDSINSTECLLAKNCIESSIEDGSANVFYAIVLPKIIHHALTCYLGEKLHIPAESQDYAKKIAASFASHIDVIRASEARLKEINGDYSANIHSFFENKAPYDQTTIISILDKTKNGLKLTIEEDLIIRHAIIPVLGKIVRADVIEPEEFILLHDYNHALVQKLVSDIIEYNKIEPHSSELGNPALT